MLSTHDPIGGEGLESFHRNLGEIDEAEEFKVEFSVYLLRRFGMRREDDIVSDNRGCEVLGEILKD